MSEGNQRRVRASDAERDETLQVLQEAYAAGRLTPEELDERQQRVLETRFVDELGAVVDDLPEAGRMGVAVTQPRSVPQPVAPHPAHQTWTIMSGRTTVIEPGTTLYRNFAWWGGDDIYLSDVMGPGVHLVLELSAIMAGSDIYVPAGVRVLDNSTAIMAGNYVESEASGDGSNGTLELRGFLFWAGHDVKLERSGRRR